MGQTKLDPERHELLLSPVVEVPLQCLGPLVLGRHDPAPGCPELLNQSHVPEHQSRLGREILHQLRLGRVHRVARRHRHREGTEQLALVPHLRAILAGGEVCGVIVRHSDRGYGPVFGPRRLIPELVPEPQPHARRNPSGSRGQDLRHAGRPSLTSRLMEDVDRVRQLAMRAIGERWPNPVRVTGNRY